MALDGGTVVIEVIGKYKNQLSPGIDNADKQIDKFEQSLQKIQKDMDKLGSKKTDLNVNDKATSSINKIMQNIKQFSGKTFKSTVKVIDYATRPLQAIKNSLFSIKGLVAAVGTGMAANKFVLNPIDLADTIESAQIGFENLLGSAEAATAKMDEIKQFAAKTPFDTMGVVSGVQRMLNSGWDAENVMRDMEILGDAAAASGNSTEGLDRIITAFSQMRMSGRVNAQDMMQLTNANIGGWKLLAEGLGTDIQTARKLAENGDIDAETGIDAIMSAMQANYAGTMQSNSQRTVKGIWSNIKDTFNIKLIERWGKGLQSGVIDGFSKMADFLDEIDPVLSSVGDSLYELGTYLSGKFSTLVGNTAERLKNALNSDEFKDADFFGKVEILWDEVIGDPFSKWWDTSGKKLFTEKAGDIGKWLGTGVTKGLLALLGIDITGAGEDGLTIGGAFCKGFIDGIDTEAIKDAFLKAFKNLAKDALKVLPGGDNPSTTSWISAALLGGAGLKLGGGKLLGKAGSKLLSSFTGKGNLAAGVSTVANGADDYAAWWSNQKLWKLNSRGSVIAENQKLWRNSTNVANATSKFSSKFSGLKNIASDKLTQGASKMLSAFGSGGKLSKLASAGSKLGKFAKGNWLSLLFSGAAIASSDDKLKTTAEQGAGLAGSAAGGAAGTKIGAAIGTFVAGPPGTAVGGAIGGLVGSTAGYIAGEKGGGKLWDSVKDWDGWDSLKEGWNGFIDGAKNFFTKTIPEKWNGFVDGAKSFFTETIPEKWNELVEGGKTFFTETIPEKWDSLVDGIGSFFTETLPYAFGYALGAAEVFFTETLPEWWNNSVEAVGTFFTETLPEWWNSAVEAVGTFFTETLPEWWSETVDSVGTFFTETLPEWWSEKMDAIGTFFTETLPGWWETTVNDFITYWTVDVPAYWNGKVDEIAEGWQEIKDKWSGAVDTITGWFSDKADTVKEKYETAKSWIDEKWTSIKDNFSEGRADAKHATGGIFSRPHVGLVAEDGPEAIIPLGGKRRQRGLDLWEKAGAALGVTPYANGGIVGNVPAGGSSNINLGGVTVNITVDGGSGTLVEALNSQSEEIKEAIAGILYDALAKNFNNMPITI